MTTEAKQIFAIEMRNSLSGNLSVCGSLSAGCVTGPPSRLVKIKNSIEKLRPAAIDVAKAIPPCAIGSINFNPRAKFAITAITETQRGVFVSLI